MSQTILASNLKKLLLEHDLSESELARRTGIGQPVIHRMISGETVNPKIATLQPIAKFFAISLDQLVGDKPLTQLTKQHLFQIPLITLEQTLRWPNEKKLIKPLDFIVTDALVGENAYAIKLVDENFSPLFPTGSLLIIDSEIKVSHRDFVLVKTKGQILPTIKQVLIEDEHYYLKPLNPEFKTFLMTEKYQIFGTMIQARIDFPRVSY